MISYEPTNTLIVSDSGNKVKRILEILELLDVQAQQSKMLIVPIKYSDPKSVADKVNQLLKGSSMSKKGSYNSFKILTDDRTNSIIIFGPPRTIKDIRAFVKRFDVPIDDPAVQATIHVRPLDYADAKKLASTLSSLASSSKGSKRAPVSRGGSSASGVASVSQIADGTKITSDAATNSLLITGSRAAYDALNSIIRKLDIRRSQVFVEADILEINENNDFKFGTSIFTGSGSEDGAKSVYGWESAKMQPLMAGANATGGQATQQTVQQIGSTFSQNLTIGIMKGTPIEIAGIGKITPGALIEVMKQDRNARVLSSPHILTSNNEEASITVGEVQMFKVAQDAGAGAAVGAAGRNTIQKENVDLTLSIKPSISYSNYVTLDVKLDQNEAKGTTAEGLPIITKRKTKQLVTVKNGQTVVVSGLVRAQETEAFKKIPLLGDIPILGWLFRNSTVSSLQSNLMIFITPHIVHGAADLAAIYRRKVRERNQVFDDIYGEDHVDHDFNKRLRHLEDGLYKPTELDKAEDKRIREQRRVFLESMGFKNIKE